MTVRLIAAIDRKNGIAKHGYQPWYIPDDEFYFAKQTKSHGGNILVGGITFRDSLKSKPLTGRHNYLLTRSDLPVAGVKLVHDLESWIHSMDSEDVWVIGGAGVYDQVMDAGLADLLYLTHIDADFGCDQFFPEYKTKFQFTSQSKPQAQNGFNFSYAVYKRQS